MKILHVTTGLHNGGAEGALTRLVLTDRENEHEVASLLGDGICGEKLRDAGIAVYPFDIRSPLKAAKSFVELIRLIRRVKPDVIQCWMYYADFLGGIAARLAGHETVVWNLRNEYSQEWKWRLRVLIAACARLSRIVPSRIVACSEEARTSHVALGYAQERVVVIGNGFDLGRFRPDSVAGKRLRSALGISQNEFLLGRVGRFAPQKDYSTLFAALRLLRDKGTKLRMLLAGANTGTQSGEIERLAKTWGVSDLLIRLGERQDVEVVMNAIDLHVSSSLIEGFPNVLVEAMACGTPCVTTSAGAASTIVRQHGWVVNRQSPDDLAGAISDALREWKEAPEGWQLRRGEGVKHVGRSFTMKAMGKSFNAVWMDVAACSRRRAPGEGAVRSAGMVGDGAEA